MSELAKIRLVLRKDFTSEWHSTEVLTSSVFFALLMLLVLNFSFETGFQPESGVGAGILWMTFLFAGILAMNRLMLNERENGGLDGLMVAPIERTSLYLAKFAALFLLLGLTEIFTLALFVVFFNVPLSLRLLQLGPVLVLGTVGLAALGTTLAAMAIRTRSREVMLPLLLIPLAVPLLIGAIEATAAIFAGRGLVGGRSWLELLVAFDAIFLGLGVLTFPAILEE